MFNSFRSQNWREAHRQIDAFRAFDSSTNAKASKKRKYHQEEVKNDNSMDYGCIESDLDTLFVPDAVQNSASIEHIPLEDTDDENDEDSAHIGGGLDYKAVFADFDIAIYVKAEIERRYYSAIAVVRDTPGEDPSNQLFNPDGGSNLSINDARSLIFHFAAAEKLKIKSIESLLILLRQLIPNAKLPETTSFAFDSFSLDEESKCIFKFHCCPCGKTVYVGDNKTAEICIDPACFYKSRYTGDERKRTARRELNYRSLALLICELIGTKSFLKAILTKARIAAEGSLSDILDGPIAKKHLKEMHYKFNVLQEHLLSKQPTIQVVEVSLLLSIYYDGAQLFSRSTVAMWPLMLSILNLPPPLRKTRGIGLFMISLFTGKPNSNSETFIIECLVKELLFLNDGFAILIDGITYVVQARLIMHCYDSRALESLVNVQGAGSYAGCPLCGLCQG